MCYIHISPLTRGGKALEVSLPGCSWRAAHARWILRTASSSCASSVTPSTRIMAGRTKAPEVEPVLGNPQLFPTEGASEVGRHVSESPKTFTHQDHVARLRGVGQAVGARSKVQTEAAAKRDAGVNTQRAPLKHHLLDDLSTAHPPGISQVPWRPTVRSWIHSVSPARQQLTRILTSRRSLKSVSVPLPAVPKRRLPKPSSGSIRNLRAKAEALLKPTLDAFRTNVSKASNPLAT